MSAEADSSQVSPAVLNIQLVKFLERIHESFFVDPVRIGFVDERRAQLRG
jgi:hypothetical protein